MVAVVADQVVAVLELVVEEMENVLAELLIVEQLTQEVVAVELEKELLLVQEVLEK